MSVSVQPNYVKVNVAPDGARPLNYKVPQEKADEFKTAFNKHTKKTSIATNTAFIASIFAGTTAALFCTRKIKSTFARYALNCLGGIAAGMGAYQICGKIAQLNQDKLVKKYHAIDA